MHHQQSSDGCHVESVYDQHRNFDKPPFFCGMFILPAKTLTYAKIISQSSFVRLPARHQSRGYEYYPGPAENPLVWRFGSGFVESMDTRLAKKV